MIGLLNWFANRTIQLLSPLYLPQLRTRRLTLIKSSFKFGLLSWPINIIPGETSQSYLLITHDHSKRSGASISVWSSVDDRWHKQCLQTIPPFIIPWMAETGKSQFDAAVHAVDILICPGILSYYYGWTHTSTSRNIFFWSIQVSTELLFCTKNNFS